MIPGFIQGGHQLEQDQARKDKRGGVCERRTVMGEFRRRQNSDRWHWSKDCSNYPTEKDVIISHTVPGYGSLCEECKKKAPLEKEK
jgi:hypothetical protein